MGDIRLRSARLGDAEVLTALMHASSAYHGEYASILVGVQVHPTYLVTHPTVVAERDGRIVGFYSLIVEPPELDLMFVADHAQGCGIGRLLIEDMLRVARGRGWRTVRVVSNPPAEGFYLALGARRTGTLEPNPPRVTWSRPDLTFELSQDDYLSVGKGTRNVIVGSTGGVNRGIVRIGGTE